MFKILSVTFVWLLLISCSSHRVKISRTIDGPKELIVNIQNDYELISLDVKESFQNEGFSVVLVQEEGKRDLVRKTKDGNEIIKNATYSQHRYELMINYDLSQERFIRISSSLRDRKENILIGTFHWSWNRMLPAPTIDKGISMLNNEFLKKIFK